MNITVLSDLVDRNPAAKAMLETLVGRPKQPRNGRVEIRRIGIETRKRGYLVSPEDLWEFAETMRKAGLGKIEQDDEGQAYFVFKKGLNVKDVLVEAIFDSLPSVPNKPSTKAQAGAESAKVLLLPSGKEISMELPEGLNKEDAQALCKMIMRRAR